MKNLDIKPETIAKYYLLKAAQEGETITQLKIQKLVYLAYAHALASGIKLFSEPIEAWPNGPVVRSLYQLLKSYGYNPIDEKFYKVDAKVLVGELSDIKEVLDQVFEKYANFTAFDLVNITHNDGAWSKARQGKTVTEHSNAAISDSDIIAAYT